MVIPPLEKLPREFYTREVTEVARDLLGKIICRRAGQVIYTGRIVEVEAYDHTGDEASHSYNGRTRRNEVMFLEGGYLYVYFTYGMHYCMNVVTGLQGQGCAVLIRAVEPLKAIEEMCLNRFNKAMCLSADLRNLTNGPAKICAAFDVNMSLNGQDLLQREIYLLNNPRIPDEMIITSKRIGIKKSAELPWRYYIQDNPFISRK